ncbi:MAG: hypothetical protein HUU38_05165 [Anaerolineales bacterium]|nr:hypothetical protein [Anaerolineales bacterium]
MENKNIIPQIVAVLLCILSLAGLLFQSAFYPMQDLQRTFVSNDVVNLLIGLPALLIPLALVRRENMMGVLLLPGALLYVTYNYLAYSFASWLSLPTFFYLALVGLSVFGFVQCLANLDIHNIQQQLHGAVPARFAGGVLTVFGLLFFFRGVGQVYSTMINSASLITPEMSVVYADMLITPLWILGGLALWRRGAWGTAMGTGLLFQASLLFVGLLVFFALQPVLLGGIFPAVDFGVIAFMGLFFFIPFGQFVKGILRLT